MLGTGASEHRHPLDKLLKFSFGEAVELGSGDRLRFVGKLELESKGERGGGMVARDHLHGDASGAALRDRRNCLGAERIDEADNSQHVDSGQVGGRQPIVAIIQALGSECQHPFALLSRCGDGPAPMLDIERGNHHGKQRLGRSLDISKPLSGRSAMQRSHKALAQSLAAPTLTALAETIHRHRKAYYAALQLGSQCNDIDAWLTWFADIVIEAQARTITRIRFLIDKTRLLDRLRGAINERQEKALLRLFREGPDGFAGGLSAGNYRTITGASLATATRDLNDLIEKGALIRTGERRYARYHLAIGSAGVTSLAQLP